MDGCKGRQERATKRKERPKFRERLQLRHNNDVIRARELRGVQPCGTWGSTTALLRPVKFTH